MDHKLKTKKILKQNIGANICDLGLDKGFLDMIPKAQKKINWKTWPLQT